MRLDNIFPFLTTKSTQKYRNLPRFKDIAVDREIVKVSKNQNRVFLVLPMLSNVSKCKVKRCKLQVTK